MSGYACVTACETTCTGAEKSGNGAGVSIATHSHCYISGHVSITNCKATGYHGAGIDFWGSNYSCTLTISGSPTITGNMCGRGYECNLYCGKSINVGDLELTRENGEVVPQVGITIQQFPIFTSGASANNDEDIEDLAKFFYADRKSAPTSIVPNASIYDIEPADNTELKQTPTIKVNMYVPSISGEDGYKLIKTLEGVPMGYISNLSTYNVTNHTNNGWNTEKGKFKSNFNNQTLTGNEDFNLYAVVLPKVNGHSLSCFEDGSIGMSIYISYDEDLGIIDSSATVKISNLTVNPNESDTIAVDPTNIKTVGNNKYVVVTYKFNPYDMTRNISETVTYSNGYSQNTSGQPNVVAGGILNGKGYGNDQKSAAAKQLASSMLVFGSRLQTQLGYYMNSSNELAEDAYTSKIMYHDPISSVPNVPEKSVVDDTSNALTFYGSSVVYNTNIEIKQYIKLNGESASDYTYAIDGEGDYAFETDNSGKYIFARIKVPAYSMDKSYEVTVKDGSGTTVLTIDYSIYNYIDSVITNKQGTAVYDTVQSLYWYGVDAKAYAGVA